MHTTVTYIPSAEFACGVGEKCLYIADLGNAVELDSTDSPDATFHRLMTTERYFERLWVSQPMREHGWAFAQVRQWLSKAALVELSNIRVMLPFTVVVAYTEAMALRGKDVRGFVFSPPVVREDDARSTPIDASDLQPSSTSWLDDEQFFSVVIEK